MFLCLNYKNWSVAVWSLIGRLPLMLKGLYGWSNSVSVLAATARLVQYPHLAQYGSLSWPGGNMVGDLCVVVVVVVMACSLGEGRFWCPVYMYIVKFCCRQVRWGRFHLVLI